MIDIKLKNVRQNERLSEETNNYSATLYVDGKKVGEVGNHGQGGPDFFHPAPGHSYKTLEEINERIARDYPQWELYDGKKADRDLEIVCGELLDEYLVEKRLKGLMRNKVVFIEGTNLYTMPIKPPHTAEQYYAHVEKKYPDAIVLNRLPFADAVKKAVEKGI